MVFITVKTFDNSGEAYVLKSKLESEGIKCYLFDENMVSLNPLYNFLIGGIKLNVSKIDLQRAIEVIAEIDNTPIINNDEILKCPKCDSTELISGFKSMRGMKGILSTIISFIFLVFPIYYRIVYKCRRCNTEFKSKML